MEFSCNLDDLEEKGLTFTEYFILWKLYNHVEYRNISINMAVYDKLISKNYIIKNDEEVQGYTLSENGKVFFEPDKSLFEEFIKIFPTRAVDSMGVARILSPATPESIAAKKLKKKWTNITRNKYENQKYIIECLKKEVDYRTKTGKLSYMKGIEAWLNNGVWEDFAYLLDEVNTENGLSNNKDIKL